MADKRSRCFLKRQVPYAHHCIDPSQQPSGSGLLVCADGEPETQKREGACQITWQRRQHLKTRCSESRSSPPPTLLILRAAEEGNESPVIRGMGAEAAGPLAALIKQPVGSIATPQGRDTRPGCSISTILMIIGACCAPPPSMPLKKASDHQLLRRMADLMLSGLLSPCFQIMKYKLAHKSWSSRE